MREGVPIASHEQRKFPPSDLNAEVRERMRKVRGPAPAPAMQEHQVQKQLAVWKFLNDQHDWLQLVFDKIFDNVGQVIAPEFPSWVLKTDEEEEEEKEAEVEEEKEEEPVSKKKVTRKQSKGKKKIVVEPEIEELYDSDKEDEELEKQMDEEVEDEEEDSDDEMDSEEEEHARGVILEEIARQKYAKQTPQAQQETNQPTPITSPTHSPIISPNQESSSHPKSPLPSLNDPPIQSPPPQTTPPPPSPEKEPEITPHTQQTISEPSPTRPENAPEQTVPSSPSHITANVVSALEKEILQEKEKEEEGLNKEIAEEGKGEESSAKEPVSQNVEMQSDAPASLAAASQQAPPQHDETAIKLVLEQMAQQKRDALHNTQKFFKKPTGKPAKIGTKKEEA